MHSCQSPRVLFSLSSFVNNPKLKGYLYDNIVCDLKVVLDNFYQNFYFELNVKLFSNFVQLTMDMLIDGLPKWKFEMRFFSTFDSWTVQSTVTLNFDREKNCRPHSARRVFLWRTAYARNVRLYCPYRQYTNLFLFQFVFEHCFRCTLCLFLYVKSRVWYKL